MTCREFKHSAAALRLWEFAARPDDAALSHADACDACGSWLLKQQALSASLQTLQRRTESCQAGPKVEQALRAAFQQATAPVKERREPFHAMFAFRLSQWFEFGAYAAVAAATAIAIFLGAHVLRHMGTQSAATMTAQPAHRAASKSGVTASVAAIGEKGVVRPHAIAKREAVLTAAPVMRKTVPTAIADDAAADAEAGYVPLMLCDPLSCSSDSQVVRMQLSSGTAQPQTADVIVGYDGVVRAVRIIN